MWLLRGDVAHCWRWAVIGVIRCCTWWMMSWWNCEVMEWSVLVRVGHPFLIPQIRSHRMRTKPRAHMAIAYSCVILVTECTLKWCLWVAQVQSRTCLHLNLPIFCIFWICTKAMAIFIIRHFLLNFKEAMYIWSRAKCYENIEQIFGYCGATLAEDIV